LNQIIEAWTVDCDAYECMQSLQNAGVPAGVCQTAFDRCDHDPQLKSLDWLTEVTGTKIGRWPVAEFPVKLAKSPAHSGGPIGRGAPCYGEDNEHILSVMLGFTESEIARLKDQGVI
jgi:crotonobetainyl-CoA:carnitine CoA-transferase CaiB-like acyl-CoA transferase